MLKLKLQPYTPTHKFNILILEDSPDDAELIEIELKRANIEFFSRLVDTKTDFIKALNNTEE